MTRIITLLLIAFFAASPIVYAQSELIVQGSAPNLFVTHSVKAKETWYSLGRTYNLTPKELASYNALAIETPLEIGQHVKIPLTSGNFHQQSSQPATETLVPLYHVVQEKEWMYRISVNHNKVPIENLEKWNNISRDEAKAGMKLIVGYLKSKQPSNISATVNNAPVTPAKEPAANTATQTSVKTTQQPTPEVASKFPDNIDFKGGYFRSQFEESGKATSGVSGIFRSTSGWKDGKYYALMNNVPIGTIVKVNFSSTNKSIYAKVLGQLPEMKESAGLAIRISDAAATELGAGNNKFTVDVRY
jgi:LysM repeat protein